ncbi:MAG: type II toxin-antitoxin system Phd/YefM family antitoxin [Polyangia bacterium]
MTIVIDQDHHVETLSVSEFKATCLAVLERVRQTGESIVITKHGQPVAEVVPPRAVDQPSRGFLGSLRGTARLVGDVTESMTSAQAFERQTIDAWDKANKT